MNALNLLIDEFLNQQDTTKVKLAKSLGFNNSNKFLRRLDTAINELNDPNHLLQKIKTELKIPKHLVHAAYADVARALTEQQKLQFKPSVNIIHIHKLEMMTAWGRNLAMEKFELNKENSVSEQFEQAQEYYQSYQAKFKDANGYHFNRTVYESYVFDVDTQLEDIISHSYSM